jgi:hypothetical protein
MLLHDEGKRISHIGVTANDTRSHPTATKSLRCVDDNPYVGMIAVSLRVACRNKHHPPLFRRLA